MENWKDFLDKKVKLIYEDSKDHFSKKEGIISEITPTHLILKFDSKCEAISLFKILRLEVCND